MVSGKSSGMQMHSGYKIQILALQQIIGQNKSNIKVRINQMYETSGQIWKTSPKKFIVPRMFVSFPKSQKLSLLRNAIFEGFLHQNQHYDNITKRTG